MIQKFDELITQELSKNLSNVAFKTVGMSNGIVMDTLFDYKTMIFIHASSVNDILVLDLCIAALQGLKSNNNSDKDKNPNDKKNVDVNKTKPLLKVPLVYSGILGMIETQNVGNIKKLEIVIKPSPTEQFILATKISIEYNNFQVQRKQSIGVMILNSDQLKSPKLQSIALLRLKSSDSRISDFMWHPLCSLTLLTLLRSQNIQIWNLRNEDFAKPSHTIKLRGQIKNGSKSNSIVEGDEKFTSFYTVDWNNDSSSSQSRGYSRRSSRINYNKFILFLMNSVGQVSSLFPFLPIGSQISRQQYDFIYSEEHLSRQSQLLQGYLNNCQMEFMQQQNTYALVEAPPPEPYLSFIKYYTSFSSKKNSNVKLRKQQYYYQLKILPLPTNNQYHSLLVIQAGRNITKNKKEQGTKSWINLGIITKSTVKTEADNALYPLAQIKNQQIDGGDLTILSFVQKQRNNEDHTHSLYFSQMNGLYKLDITSIYKFVRTNQLKHIQNQSSFEVAFIFQIPLNESICAMAIEQSVQCIHFIRRTQNKIKFQIQPISYLDSFSQVQNINKASNQLISKMNSLKIDMKQPATSKQSQKIAQLNISAQKIKLYKEQQQKGIQNFKSDYVDYCENIKNSIDQSMSKLKITYETMRKKIKIFNQHKSKRNQLSQLLNQVQNNNESINKLLFADKSQASQDRNQKNDQLSEMEKNINNLSKLLETAKAKKLSLTQDAQNSMKQKMSAEFENIKQVRKNLQQAKNFKKQYYQYKK